MGKNKQDKEKNEGVKDVTMNLLRRVYAASLLE